MIGFLDLPGQIRNMIYRQLIVTGLLVSPPDQFVRTCLHVSLIYTNRTIHHEYGTLVYSSIDFDFTHHTHERTARFLDQIGRNAKHIRRICTRFPTFIENVNDLTFDEESIKILDKIKSACPGLEWLFCSPAYVFDLRVRPYLGSPEKTDKLLSLVTNRLGSFSSPKSISVAIPACEAYIRISYKLGDSYGWDVCAVEDWDPHAWSSEEDEYDGEIDDHIEEYYSQYSDGSGEYESDGYSSDKDSSEEDDDSSESSEDSGEDDYDGHRGLDDGFGEDDSDYDNACMLDAGDIGHDSSGDEEFRQDDLEDSHPTSDWLHMLELSSQ